MQTKWSSLREAEWYAKEVTSRSATKGSWMVKSLSKPPSGKCGMVGRSLEEGCSGKVKLEMFNPSEENVVLHKNTHTAVVHPVDVEDTELQEKTQTDKELSSVRKITKGEPLPDEL